jgi:surface polysaccharide O-acyltransferase-like enzyme
VIPGTDRETIMKTQRKWMWAALALGATVFQFSSCFSLDRIGQVLADEVALTGATLVRELVGAAFGAASG